MNAGQLAALIAAGFFAAGVCGALYVLARLARLISAATTALAGYQASTEDLLRRAHAAVDLAEAHLQRTGTLADGVEQVSASMTDLSEQVSAVAGTARLIATGLGTPVLRLAAAGHGIRRALAIRRAGSVAVSGGRASRAAQARARQALRPGASERAAR